MIQIQNRLLKEAAEKGTRINEEELTKRVYELLNENGKFSNSVLFIFFVSITTICNINKL